jgi:hypothetical protein
VAARPLAGNGGPAGRWCAACFTPEWQPYADRTALAYGIVNPDRHVEIQEIFVQDGPCQVTPATTHCQAWLQILPEIPSDD